VRIKDPLDVQVRRGLLSIDTDPRFCASSTFWLTFYLTGNPSSLWLVSEALAVAGWINTGDWDGGFLYPKVQAPRSEPSVLSIAAEVLRLSQEHGVSLIGIDADTSPDVEQSKFAMLYSD
jgi:hypothetical protein